MLEDRPLLKDRLMAFGAFAGIAVAAVAGFEFVVTGGFDLPIPGAARQPQAEHADYVTVVESASQPNGVTTRAAYAPTLFVDDAYTDMMPVGELAGGADDVSASNAGDAAWLTVRPESDIYHDIEFLDEETSTYVEPEARSADEPAYRDGAPAYDDPDATVEPSDEAATGDEATVTEELKLSASGSASPW